MYKVQYVTHFHVFLSTPWYTFFTWRGELYEIFLALVGTLLCTSQSGFAISQYEIEQKPTQYQLAYLAIPSICMSILARSYKQTAANYKNGTSSTIELIH